MQEVLKSEEMAEGWHVCIMKVQLKKEWILVISDLKVLITWLSSMCILYLYGTLVLVKQVDSGITLPGFESQPCYLLAVTLQELLFLTLIFC